MARRVSHVESVRLGREAAEAFLAVDGGTVLPLGKRTDPRKVAAKAALMRVLGNEIAEDEYFAILDRAGFASKCRDAEPAGE